jgi:uncharacterized protein YkwD
MKFGGFSPLLRAGGLTVAVLALGLSSGCSGFLPAVGPAREPVADMPVDQAAAIALVSDYRKAHGLAPVSGDAVLQHVAQAQAEAMASANELSHNVDGLLPARLAPYGRGRGASVENVSAGYATLAAALGGWRRSAEHNANLLYGPMRRIGVAAASAPGTRYKTYWALVMTD